MKRSLFIAVFAMLALPAFGQSLAQQKVCYDQAHKVFDQQYPDSVILKVSLLTTHYNVSKNVCYVEVIGFADDGETLWLDVSDAFGNTLGTRWIKSVSPNPEKWMSTAHAIMWGKQ